eukprot:1139209-Pelagomonas_calceolata.AAC.2
MRALLHQSKKETYWLNESTQLQGTGVMESGMSNLDSSTYTQEDCMEGDLSTLKLFAHFTFMKLPDWSCAALLTFPLLLILRPTSGST